MLKLGYEDEEGKYLDRKVGIYLNSMLPKIDIEGDASVNVADKKGKKYYIHRFNELSNIQHGLSQNSHPGQILILLHISIQLPNKITKFNPITALRQKRNKIIDKI